MSDISVGAVGAALIAGLVSLFGLVIGKEQKVSEFRQAWINDLRNSMITYLVSINAISDAIRSKKVDSDNDNKSLLENYKNLNQAHHGIILRINAEENTSKAMLSAMKEFDDMARSNAGLIPDRIKSAEDKFLDAAKELLKFEWKRVKRGEDIYVWTKRIVIGAIVSMLILMASLWWIGNKTPQKDKTDNEWSLHLLHL